MLIPFLDWSSHHGVFYKDWLDDLKKIYESGVFLFGPFTQKFEFLWAQFCSYSEESLYCTAVANGLDALTLSIRALDLEPNSEILIPGNTFIATALAVINAGHKPVLVPPSQSDYTISVEALDGFLSDRTRAVIPVHLYGRMCRMPEICSWADYRKIVVIEDAAQAHGAEIDGRRAGSWGVSGCFSFYPGKNLGSLGDAGAVVASSAPFVKKIKMLGNYGSERKYDHTESGVNSRIDEIQAAFLMHKLRFLKEQLVHRREVAQVLLDELPRELILPPRDDKGFKSAWHLFVVRHPERDRLQQFLKDSGIESIIHYPKSIDQHAAFQKAKLAPCVASRKLSEQILSLPIGPHIQGAQLEYMIKIMRSFFGE